MKIRKKTGKAIPAAMLSGLGRSAVAVQDGVIYPIVLQ